MYVRDIRNRILKQRPRNLAALRAPARCASFLRPAPRAANPDDIRLDNERCCSRVHTQDERARRRSAQARDHSLSHARRSTAVYAVCTAHRTPYVRRACAAPRNAPIPIHPPCALRSTHIDHVYFFRLYGRKVCAWARLASRGKVELDGAAKVGMDTLYDNNTTILLGVVGRMGASMSAGRCAPAE